MPDATVFAGLAGWMETHILDSALFAAVGFAALVGVGVSLLVLSLRLLGHMARSARTVSNGTVRRAASEPGYRVLVGEFEGVQGMAAGQRLEDALRAHLTSFCFGAMFRLFRVAGPVGRPEGEILRRARRKLKKTGGDILIWGEREGDRLDGLLVYGVSRAGSLTADEARPFTLRLPGDLRVHDLAVDQAGAYLIAKMMQPTLARPEAFREERVAELGNVLDSILEADDVDRSGGTGEGVLPAIARREIEQDFSSIALHLSETSPRDDWLEKIIARRRATLETLKQVPDLDALVDARLDLGQVLLKRAESRFDPVAVREATVHLNAVVETLRGSDIIRKVQRASDGLQRAQGLVETRRRFAVNFSA